MTLVNESRNKGIQLIQSAYPEEALPSDGDLWKDVVKDELYVFSRKLNEWIPFGIATTDYTFGSLWSWGYNPYGALGHNDILRRSSPAQVGILGNWVQVSINMHLLAAKANGSLWVCGRNEKGQLGFGDRSLSSYRSSPVQLGYSDKWRQVSASMGFSHAIQRNGTLWAWGYNFYGQLGTNNQISSSSPIQVGSLSNWKSISNSDANFAAAIKTDGTLWSWGNNIYGPLGLGDTIQRSSPVQIGSLSDWKSVICGSSCVLAIKNNGTLWAWGFNLYGELGLLDRTHRSSPTQIGSLTTWIQVATSGYYALAVKNDGTLWGWGRNDYGGLGSNDIIYKSSPVQIGSLTTWSSVVSGTSTSIALKIDGTLWGWGANWFGYACTGDLINRSSPVQIGSLTIWKKIFGKSVYFAAIQDQ